MSHWRPTINAKLGVVIYDYSGRPEDSRFLPLCFGDLVQIVEECGAWYRGFSVCEPVKKGIFPASFVHLKSHRLENLGLHERVIAIDDPVAQEVTAVLREWNSLWKRLYQDHKNSQCGTIKTLILQLIDFRSQILSGTLPATDLLKLKKKVTSKIDWGNRVLNLDLVPRGDNGEIVTEDNTSVLELFRVHQRCANSLATATITGTIKPVRTRPTAVHHLFAEVTGFACNVGDEVELYVSLFDLNSMRYISERYLVKLNKNGAPRDVKKMGQMCALFTDLGTKELTGEIWLVFHIIRVGKMLAGSGHDSRHTKQSTSLYRRPFGCAAMSVAEILVGNLEPGEEEREHRLQIYQSTSEENFAQLHLNVMKKNQKEYKQLQQQGAAIFVCLRMLHGALSSVIDDNPHLFQRSVAITRKLGFPDVIMPEEVRNDLYIVLDYGDFQQGSKTAPKNVEAMLEVVSEAGEVLKGCIFPGAGEDPVDEFKSVVLYHRNDPKWDETVKIVIPIERFYSCHLRFTFRHRTSNPSGSGAKGDKHSYLMSFVKLMNMDGTTLADTKHELVVYKCEPKYKLNDVLYLRHSFTKSDMLGKGSSTLPSQELSSGLSLSGRETVAIRSLVCSTKLTHNVDLLGVLKWRLEPQKLESNLRALMKVDGEETVKFLQDTFDALFAILDDNMNQHGHLVFEAIVFIIGLLSDKKYHHFRPVLESYIDRLFANATAHTKLIELLRRQVDHIDEGIAHQSLLKTMRGLEYVFRFIVRSRELYAKANKGRGLSEFKHSLHSLFHSFNAMMVIDGDTKDYAVPIQAAALQHFPSTFGDLQRVLEVGELSVIVRDFIDSIPMAKMTRFKMLSIRNIVTNHLFRSPEARIILMPMVVKHTQLHLTQRDELHQCVDILGELLTILEDKAVGTTRDNVSVVVQSLFRTVLMTVGAVDRNSSYSGQLVSSLVAILRIMDVQHYRDYISSFVDREPLLEFLIEVFGVFMDLVTRQPYSQDWFVMAMLHNSGILSGITSFSEALYTHFLTVDLFDLQLWNTYFHLSVAFVCQETLHLEKYSLPKQRKVLRRYGDMRVVMNRQVLDMWNSLEDLKMRFIPDLVGPFVEMALIDHDEIRRNTIPVFMNMMDCELQSTGDFRRVESELIDKLDTYVSGGGRGDDRFKDNLFKILSVETNRYPELQKAGVSQFIESITQLLSRLLDFRNVPEGEENRNQRMSTISNLLHLYREMEREEMYIRYIYKLCSMHLQWGNYTEAAFTLMLHAKKLQWHDFPAPQVPGKYAEAATQRLLKEMLYENIIEYFDKGKLWEYSITVSKELALHYETVVYDYDRLSSIYQTIGESFHKIVHSVRAALSYFRVGFYGHGFLPSLKNKLFIYRGGEYENIGDFNARLTAEFPNAQMLKKSTPPDQEILDSAGQYIQTCTVEPLPEEPDKFQGKNVAEAIQGFHTHNDVRQFRVDRPFHRGVKDKGNEFATLWIERTTYQTAESLPGILRWSEVQFQPQSVELCPIENALESVLNRNKDMQRVIAQCQADPAQGVMSLGMSVNGVIDAAVNGGVAKYEMAFFGSEYLKANADHEELVAKLRDAITHQVEICGEALAVHGRYAPETLQPFQQKMVEMYEPLKKKYPPEKRSLHFLRASFRNRSSPVQKQQQQQRRQDSTETLARPVTVSYSASNVADGRGRGHRMSERGARSILDPLPPIPAADGSPTQDKRLSEIPRSSPAATDDRPSLPTKMNKPSRSHTLVDRHQNRHSSADTVAGLTPPPKPARPSPARSATDSAEKRPPKPYRPQSVNYGVSIVNQSSLDVGFGKPPKQVAYSSFDQQLSPVAHGDFLASSAVVPSVCETQIEVDVVDPKPEYIPKFKVSDVLPMDGTLDEFPKREANGPAEGGADTSVPPARPPKLHRVKMANQAQSVDSLQSSSSAWSVDSVDSVVDSGAPALPTKTSVSSRTSRLSEANLLSQESGEGVSIDSTVHPRSETYL